MKSAVAALFVALALAAAIQAGAVESGPKLAPIQITPERRQLIGLQYAKVEDKDLIDRIDATGLVEADEQLQGYVQTRFSGWIRQVFVDRTYQHVEKGQRLFTIYSPDLVSAENEYLIALNTESQLKSSEIEGVAGGAQSLVGSAVQRLKLFGVSPREIARLQRERTVRDAVEIDSPMTGYVVERNALPNMYAQPDTKLYAISSLTSVWVYAAIFQNQLGRVKVGDPVSVTVDSYPGKTFAGRVDSIWEAIDPMTRTAKVRCSLSNSESLLKLGMYVAVTLKPNLGRGLVIPDTAVFRTGEHNIVFIDRGDGYLTPIGVELGAHVGHDFSILKGLKVGEQIVSSANFLIDSESQLQAAAGTFVPPPPGVSAAAGQPQISAPKNTIGLSTEPSPLARGKNKLRLTLTDEAGKPVSGAQVAVTFYMAAMPAMGMAALRAQATALDQGNGTYLGDVNLQSGGTWQMTILATQGGQTIAIKQTDVNVSGPMAM